MKKINRKKSLALWQEAKKIIPGGSQLLSKRAEMFLPGQWPAYFSKAKGVFVWDLDGNKYVDTLGSIGASILGYADVDVDKAVKKAIATSVVSSLNAPEEVELAKLLLKLHPWAKKVRYARTGGEAMAVAVRIARAYSGKDKVAFCGYHGWHDWYLASNLASNKNLDGHLLPGLKPAGVPRSLQGTAIPFHYNNIEELEKIMAENSDVGVIVMEPARNHEPTDNFLQKVQNIANKYKAVLVFDEITIGWRLVAGGAHLKYKVTPDIAVFAKAISNGYPMAAIIGKEDVMEACQESFISSSYWTERVGPTAALATITKIIKKKVLQHLEKMGELVRHGLLEASQKTGLKVTVEGFAPLIHFSFDYGEKSQALMTLFRQEMLERGFLVSGGFYMTYSFKEKDIKNYLNAVHEVFGIATRSIEHNNVEKLLKGPMAQKGFQRLT